jgi:hypothetical protein
MKTSTNARSFQLCPTFARASLSCLRHSRLPSMPHPDHVLLCNRAMLPAPWRTTACRNHRALGLESRLFLFLELLFALSSFSESASSMPSICTPHPASQLFERPVPHVDPELTCPDHRCRSSSQPPPLRARLSANEIRCRLRRPPAPAGDQ